MSVKQQVFDVIIEQFSVPKNEIKDTSSLVKDFHMDGFDLVELTMALESEFNITIEDDDAKIWMFVSDVVNYMNEATEEQKP